MSNYWEKFIKETHGMDEVEYIDYVNNENPKPIKNYYYAKGLVKGGRYARFINGKTKEYTDVLIPPGTNMIDTFKLREFADHLSGRLSHFQGNLNLWREKQIYDYVVIMAEEANIQPFFDGIIELDGDYYRIEVDRATLEIVNQDRLVLSK